MRSAAFIDPDVKSYVDYAVQGAYMKAQALRSAFVNRIGAAAFSITASLTAPSNAILMAAPVVAKASGLFLVLASGTCVVGAPEAGGANVLLTVQGPLNNGATITVNNGAATGGIYNSSATTAITLSASSGSMGSNIELAEENGLNNLASSATAMPFSFAGIYGTGTGANSGVLLGNSVSYNLSVTFATSSILLQNVSFSVMEIPA